MKNKQFIFIDLDGTILDVSERTYRVYYDILKKYKKRVLSKRKYLNLKKEKKPIEEILRETEAEDILQNYKEEWLKNIEKEKYLKLDKISFLKKKTLLDLKKRNNLVLVSSRKKRKLLYKQIKKIGISKIFRKIIIIPEKWEDRVRFLKNKIKNKNYILIGDTESYILTGKNLGVKTIAVYDGVRSRSFLNKFSPDFLIKNIAGIKKYVKRI